MTAFDINQQIPQADEAGELIRQLAEASSPPLQMRSPLLIRAPAPFAEANVAGPSQAAGGSPSISQVPEEAGDEEQQEERDGEESDQEAAQAPGIARVRRYSLPPLGDGPAAHQNPWLHGKMKDLSLDYDGDIIQGMLQYEAAAYCYRSMSCHNPPTQPVDDATWPHLDEAQVQCVRQLYEAALDFSQAGDLPKKKKKPTEPLDESHESYELRLKLLAYGIETAAVDLQIKF
jgi:hypothetical protein